MADIEIEKIRSRVVTQEAGEEKAIRNRGWRGHAHRITYKSDRHWGPGS
jgi:hypothetical protein